MDGVSACVNQERVHLVDISRRGVLLRTTTTPSVGSTTRVQLWRGDVLVELTGRVVRVERLADHDEQDEAWLVGLEFLRLTQEQVATRLRPLFASLVSRSRRRQSSAA